MPRLLSRQTSRPQDLLNISAEDPENRYGDSVVIDGFDAQAVRRAHMRAQTTARQIAERRAEEPRGLPNIADRSMRMAALQDRKQAHRVDMAAINDAHQVWLHTQEEPAQDTREGVPQVGALPTSNLHESPTAPSD